MQSLTDNELMLKYQQGEMRAMEELIRRYKNPVYHFVFRLCLNASEAEDITQDVFLKVHQHKLKYNPSLKFSTWVFSIAHHSFVSRWRKDRWFVLWPRKQDSDELVEVEDPNPSPQEKVCTNDLNETLKECVAALPLPQREVLMLREFENMDYHEIAKVLRKPVGTIKTLIHRARMALKEKLAPYYKELGGCHV